MVTLPEYLLYRLGNTATISTVGAWQHCHNIYCTDLATLPQYLLYRLGNTAIISTVQACKTLPQYLLYRLGNTATISVVKAWQHCHNIYCTGLATLPQYLLYRLTKELKKWPK